MSSTRPQSAPSGVFSDNDPVCFRVNADRDDRPPEFSLIYFAMRGRAEVARLILEEAQVPHNQVIWWVGPKWKAEQKPKTPLGMLPVLELPNGEVLAQSATIVRYLAQRTCLDGGPTLSGRLRADMIYETAIELKELKGELAAGAEHSDLQSMIDGKAGNQRWGKLVGLMSALEKFLAEGSGQYFVADKLSFADLAVFNTLEYLEGVQPGCLEKLNCSKLHNFRNTMAQRPCIARYLASDRCYPLTELEINAPGHQTNGVPMGLKYTKSLRTGQWCQASKNTSTDLLVPSIQVSTSACSASSLPSWLLPLSLGLAIGCFAGSSIHRRCGLQQ
eukprot:TRINITY_DN50525_c0_g1_i1.p1 TRINITY_DN50525_c0_g1~~TRINITY_DN50525_c0_g1_i1.p1  ORF type:complete len:332 (+),score=41.19 TRINITY_DN50525_c0_g1_i1:144-1139(+)